MTCICSIGKQCSLHFFAPRGSFARKWYWWFSDREIANHAKTEQTLAPR